MRDDLEALVAEAAAARALHEPHHERHPAHPRAARAAPRPRARQRADLDPGRVGRGRPTGSPGCARSTASSRSPRWVKELGLPLTLNIVLHRENLDRVAEVVALAERARGRSPGAREHAVPRLGARSTGARSCRRREQLDARPGGRGRGAGERLRGGWRSSSSRPTTTPSFPKACMDGWGRRFIARRARTASSCLPRRAHAARARVRERPRAARSPRSGATRRASTPSAARPGWRSRAGAATGATLDFGGCRCQAYHLTGDAAATDPACSLAPTTASSRRRAGEAVDPGAPAFEYRMRRAGVRP